MLGSGHIWVSSHFFRILHNTPVCFYMYCSCTCFMQFNMNIKLCMINLLLITNSLFLCICLYLLDVPGEQIQEGKTKIIYEHSENTVYVLSKDRISANNAQRVNDLEGKAAISTATTCKVFEFLEQTGKEQMFSCFKSPYTEPLNGERCLMDP